MEHQPIIQSYLEPVVDIWEAAVTHRFVQELTDGTLADSVLADYLVQDYQFCDDFVALMGQSVASADTIEAKLALSRQLGFIANDENTYFQDCFKEFGVADSEVAAPQLKAATQGFRNLMQKTVQTRSYPHLLTLLVVAEGLYLDWADRASENGTKLPERWEHRGWFEVHRGADFTAWVRWLENELQRVADPQDQSLKVLFSEAVTLERQFFDEAYMA